MVWMVIVLLHQQIPDFHGPNCRYWKFLYEAGCI